MRKALLLLGVSIILMSGCTKEDMPSKIPSIKFESANPLFVKTRSEDVIELMFSFKDGDADLGNIYNSGKYDIFIKTNRSDTINYKFYFPNIQDQISSDEYGISGYASIPIPAGKMILSKRKKADTFHFEVYIKDKAGNQSNTILTPDIVLSH